MNSNHKFAISTKSERDMLKIFRYFLLAFTEGSQTHWETAMSISRGEHGLDAGRDVGFAILRVLQSVREARSNAFLFIHPGCDKCATGLLDCERYLMHAINCVFKNDLSAAQVSLILLCEGTDTKAVIGRIKELADYINLIDKIGDEPKPSSISLNK